MKINLKNKALFGCLLIFLASFFWGSTFVAQSSAAQTLSALTYLSARSFVGAAALLAVIAVRSLFGRRKKAQQSEKSPVSLKRTLIGGTVCGLALTAASYLQQEGISKGATAGEAGFLTALYMFFVPILSFFLFKKKPTFNLLPGAVLMAEGLYFLCIMDKGWSSFGPGHFLILGCAFAYAVHILFIDRYGDIDGMMLSFIQFTVCGVCSLIFAVIFEKPSFGEILDAWFPIVYAGIFSSAIAFTLQIYGQKYAPPALASIIMSLESVIALITEWLSTVIGIYTPETPIEMTGYKALGCVLAFAGIVIAQLSVSVRPKKRKKEDRTL